MNAIPHGDIPRYHAERKEPGSLAAIYPEGALSWWELERRATRRARLFQSLGVQQDDLVTVALPNGLLFHETVFAIWKCGATPNIVSSRLPEHEFRAIVELVKPKLVVGRPIDRLRDIRFIAGDADTSAFTDTPFDAGVARYWKAMTSGGSTGRPKIIVDHNPAAFDFDAIVPAHRYFIERDMVVLNPGPLYHNGPFVLSHLGLLAGNKVVGMARFDAEDALRLIDAHNASFVMFVPTMLHRIWLLPADVRTRYDLSSLKIVWHMAAPCPDWLKTAWIEWLGAERIWELYGGTEAVGATIIRGDEWLTRRGSVGRSIDPTAVKVLREDGTEAAAGEIGEIYFRLPDLNAPPSHYIGAEPKRDTDGWQSLGDLGHLDEDRFLFLADRRTDLILRGGANIYPAEVEAALDAYPKVASSVVVSVPCDDLGHRVHAIVQPKPDEMLELPELHAFVRQRLATYKLPESYEIVMEPLRDDAGKVRRSALRDMRLDWLKEGRDFRLKAPA